MKNHQQQYIPLHPPPHHHPPCRWFYSPRFLNVRHMLQEWQVQITCFSANAWEDLGMGQSEGEKKRRKSRFRSKKSSDSGQKIAGMKAYEQMDISSGYPVWRVTLPENWPRIWTIHLNQPLIFRDYVSCRG